jgi:hypothetical protein
MGCEECDKVQDLAFNKNIPETTPIAYVRIGSANVAIVACPKHARETCNRLNEWSRMKEEKP